jgi:hypothetical protein
MLLEKTERLDPISQKLWDYVTIPRDESPVSGVESPCMDWSIVCVILESYVSFREKIHRIRDKIQAIGRLASKR